jgi:hypothetical protein
MKAARIANRKNRETAAMKQKIVLYAALLSNVLLIIVTIFIFSNTYGGEKFLALLFAIPPILSLMVIIQGPDSEERKLQKRLRKANLRKELKSLSDFDA